MLACFAAHFDSPPVVCPTRVQTVPLYHLNIATNQPRRYTVVVVRHNNNIIIINGINNMFTGEGSSFRDFTNSQSHLRIEKFKIIYIIFVFICWAAYSIEQYITEGCSVPRGAESLQQNLACTTQPKQGTNTLLTATNKLYNIIKHVCAPQLIFDHRDVSATNSSKRNT